MVDYDYVQLCVYVRLLINYLTHNRKSLKEEWLGLRGG